MDDNPAEQPAAEQAQAPAQVESITLTDLKNVLVLIDLCSQRGAFRGPELSSVATLHDKISAFLAFAEQSQNTNPTGV